MNQEINSIQMQQQLHGDEQIQFPSNIFESSIETWNRTIEDIRKENTKEKMNSISMEIQNHIVSFQYIISDGYLTNEKQPSREEYQTLYSEQLYPLLCYFYSFSDITTLIHQFHLNFTNYSYIVNDWKLLKNTLMQIYNMLKNMKEYTICKYKNDKCVDLIIVSKETKSMTETVKKPSFVKIMIGLTETKDSQKGNGNPHLSLPDKSENNSTTEVQLPPNRSFGTKQNQSTKPEIKDVKEMKEVKQEKEIPREMKREMKESENQPLIINEMKMERNEMKERKESEEIK